LWNIKKNSNLKPDKQATRNISDEKLEKLSKQELVEICENLNINSKGTKKVLIASIKKSKTNKNKLIKNKSGNEINISKNKFGNYEHNNTKFIFNKNDKIVIGKQLESGEIAELTISDINLCNKYKFEYNLPDNLNTENSDDDIIEEDQNDDGSDDGSDDGGDDDEENFQEFLDD